jgi:hypothetical protein
MEEHQEAEPGKTGQPEELQIWAGAGLMQN